MCKRIQILGDSISVGYGLSKDEMSFVTLLEKHSEFVIDVFAFCGQTTQDLIQNLKQKPPVAVKYDVSIILIGTNGSLSNLEFSSLITEVSKTSKEIIACTVPIETSNNNVIREIANQYPIVLSDINKGWKNEYFMSDEIHPNKDGHLYLYKNLFDILRKK